MFGAADDPVRARHIVGQPARAVSLVVSRAAPRHRQFEPNIVRRPGRARIYDTAANEYAGIEYADLPVKYRRSINTLRYSVFRFLNYALE